MKFRMRRTFSLLLVLLLAVAMIAGCAKTETPPAEPAPAPSTGSAATPPAEPPKAEPVTLDVWIMPNSPQSDQDLLDVLRPYTDQNQHITINVTVLDWGSAWTKITTAVTSGEGPDVLQLGTTWVPAIAAMGGLMPLADRVGEIGGKDAFFPASWNTTGILGETEVYAVPWFVDARAVLYRTDVFAKAGVDPAAAFANWENFKQALKEINNTDIDGKQVKAIGFPGKNDWNVAHNVIPWVWAAGGDALSPDASRPVINSSAALDGLMYYTSLAAEGMVPLEALEKNTAEVEAMYTNGDFAVMISGPWMVARYRTPPDRGGNSDTVTAQNYAVAPIPAGPTGTYTFFGGSNLAVFGDTDAPEEAWGLIKHLETPAGQLAYSQISGMLPAQKAVFDDPFFASDPAYNQFRKAAEYGRSYPPIPQWGAVEAVLNRHFGIIWDITAGVSGKYDQNSVRAELDTTAQEIVGVLKQ